MSLKSVTVSNWYTVSNWARSNQVPASIRYTVSIIESFHLMQCLDYFKSRSVIGTLVATENDQRLIVFFKDEFDLLLDMNSDPSIFTI